MFSSEPHHVSCDSGSGDTHGSCVKKRGSIALPRRSSRPEPSTECIPDQHRARCTPAAIAERLQISADTKSAVRRENWYFADAEPMQIGITYIPWDIAKGSALARSDDLGPGSLRAIRGHGTPHHVHPRRSDRPNADPGRGQWSDDARRRPRPRRTTRPDSISISNHSRSPNSSCAPTTPVSTTQSR